MSSSWCFPIILATKTTGPNNTTMACTACGRRFLPSCRRRSSSWLPTLLLSASAAAVASAAAAFAFHLPPSSSRSCSSREALPARGSWPSVGEGAGGGCVKLSQPQARQRRCRADRTAAVVVLSSMAPGAGVMAQGEDDRTRYVLYNTQYCKQETGL